MFSSESIQPKFLTTPGNVNRIRNNFSCTITISELSPQKGWSGWVFTKWIFCVFCTGQLLVGRENTG